MKYLFVVLGVLAISIVPICNGGCRNSKRYKLQRMYGKKYVGCSEDLSRTEVSQNNGTCPLPYFLSRQTNHKENQNDQMKLYKQECIDEDQNIQIKPRRQFYNRRVHIRNRHHGSNTTTCKFPSKKNMICWKHCMSQKLGIYSNGTLNADKMKEVIDKFFDQESTDKQLTDEIVDDCLRLLASETTDTKCFESNVFISCVNWQLNRREAHKKIPPKRKCRTHYCRTQLRKSKNLRNNLPVTESNELGLE